MQFAGHGSATPNGTWQLVTITQMQTAVLMAGPVGDNTKFDHTELMSYQQRSDLSKAK